MLTKLEVTWTGVRPLLMHNGQLVDDQNPIAIKIARINKMKGRNLTDEKRIERQNLEWEGSLYYNDELGPLIPSDNIERCIQIGAQKEKLGKIVQAAVFCSEPEVPLEYDGPRKLDGLRKDARFHLRKGVRVGQARVIRDRPMFSDWRLRFHLEFDSSEDLNVESVLDAMTQAGFRGLGDWRPKFGRFTSEAQICE